MSRVSAVAVCFTALGVVVASLGPAWPAPRDDWRIGKGNFDSKPDPGPGNRKADFGSGVDPGPDGPGPEFVDPGGNATDQTDPTMPSGLPGHGTADLHTKELTIDAAKRAIDAFVAVRDKYNDHGIENYISLEAFVAETEAGKRLEAEVISHGFSDITDWNLTIMAVGFSYSAIVYDYATDLRQQIEDVRDDRSLDEEMRARLIAGLTALLPSRNNRLVLQALFDDPIYRDKLKLLQEEE